VCSVHRLNPDGRCESENIKVFDGSSTSGPLLGKVCNKNDFVPVFESSSNSLTVQIVTDSTIIQRTVFVFYYFFSSDTCKLSFMHHFPAPSECTGHSCFCPGCCNLESESASSETSLQEEQSSILSVHKSQSPRFWFLDSGEPINFPSNQLLVKQRDGAFWMALGWRMLC
jgi:hypothetical protein